MNHLNEDKLIQYAFNLMEAGDKETAQKHLDECGDCRNALAALQAKFAAMAVLADEVPPSEELIRQTLAVKDTVKAIPLYRHRWVEWSATAAAVAIICILLLQNLPNPRVKSSPPAKGEYPEGGRGYQVASKPDQDSVGTAYPTEMKSELEAAKPVAMKLSENSRTRMPDRLETGVRIVSADEIPNVPPFAPASAIELVVLPKPDKMQVTIYNSADLTLVRDTRKLTLKPGWNWLQFMWSGTQIDPTSLSLTPLEHADKVDIQLISYPARLKDVGRWLIRSEVEGAVPFEITYFASGLSWRAFYMGTMNEDETMMDLKGYVNVSNNSGQDFENTQTRLIVGETRLTEEIRYLAQRHYPYGPDIKKYADEINFPRNWKEIKEEDLESARKRVRWNYAYGDGLGIAGSVGGRLFGIDGETNALFSIKDVEKTGLSEYFLYTIEGTENLTNQWTKRLPSLDVADIPVKSLYKYDEDRYGKQAVRFVSFANDTEHELGETPIPEGSIKIYRNVNDQHKSVWHGLPARDSRPGWPCHENTNSYAMNLSYIGGSNIKYIPVNEDIELNLGPARLVKVEPVLTKTKTENYTFDRKGNITGWDDIESCKVTITNTRDIPIDIEITWNMGTDAWELTYIDIASNPENAITYKKHDKNRARFTMTVRPQSEKVLPMIIRKYRQKRIEAYVEKERGQEK